VVEEQSEFMREIRLRNERGHRLIASELREQTATLVALQAEIADQREQIQAETQAIYSVLDRLN
jgi:hypothetical protein